MIALKYCQKTQSFYLFVKCHLHSYSPSMGQIYNPHARKGVVISQQWKTYTCRNILNFFFQTMIQIFFPPQSVSIVPFPKGRKFLVSSTPEKNSLECKHTAWGHCATLWIPRQLHIVFVDVAIFGKEICLKMLGVIMCPL